MDQATGQCADSCSGISTASTVRDLGLGTNVGKFVAKVLFAKSYAGHHYICMKDDIKHRRVEILYIQKTTSAIVSIYIY